MRDIASLTSALEFWDVVSYWATAIVLVGVVGETVTDLFEWIKDPTWRKRVEKVSALILIVGLAGELVSQGRLSRASSEITALLNGQTADANKAAGTAIQGTSEAKKDTAIALLGSAKANAEAAKANATAEGERLARMKLEAQIAPRHLSRADQEALAESLRRFAGESVTVGSPGMDLESRLLGQQLLDTFQMAGMEVVPDLSGEIGLGGIRIGVHVSGPPSRQVLVGALVLHLSLEGKLGGVVREPPGAADRPVRVSIGVKPIS